VGASAIRSIAIGNTAQTNGASSVMIGSPCGNSTMSGTANICIGSSSSIYLTTGYQNVSVGDLSSKYMSTGYINTAVGASALASVTTGYENVGVGYNGGLGITTGLYNTCVGANAGFNVSGSVGNGLANTLIGTAANSYNASSDVNFAIAVGYNASCSASSSVAIGANIVANQSGGIFLKHRAGVYTVVSTGFITGSTNELVENTSSIRYKENIRNLESVGSALDAMRPVRYTAKPGMGDDREHIGFIAEEMNEIFPEFVTRNTDGQINALMYDQLVTVMAKELQEMRQRERDTQAVIADLLNRVAALEQ
jgi:hypothetical protein